ncbi:MAG: glycosyltransferase [Pirellulales bacterium]|nr:glycosyltransferase [Pirellulales bacterium]
MMAINFNRKSPAVYDHKYQAPRTPLPSRVIPRDAATILPAADVFCYPVDGPLDMPFGKGSYAGFSDIFRYKLLYGEGGWYSDMDVTCLKPPLFETEYVFRSHWQFPTVGNIMRCPRGSELMRRCYEVAKEAVTPQNREWNLPIRILNEQVSRLGLEPFIRQDICNSDSPAELRELLTGTKPIPREWHFVHWCAALGGWVGGEGVNWNMEQGIMAASSRQFEN